MVLTIGAVCGKNLIYSEGGSNVTKKMEELGPHQATIGPHQVDDNLHQAESRGSQHSNPYDHEGSAHTNHINRGQSRGKGHVSYAKNDKDMQCEIDELKKELRHAR